MIGLSRDKRVVEYSTGTSSVILTVGGRYGVYAWVKGPMDDMFVGSYFSSNGGRS